MRLVCAVDHSLLCPLMDSISMRDQQAKGNAFIRGVEWEPLQPRHSLFTQISEIVIGDRASLACPTLEQASNRKAVAMSGNFRTERRFENCISFVERLNIWVHRGARVAMDLRSCLAPATPGKVEING